MKAPITAFWKTALFPQGKMMAYRYTRVHPTDGNCRHFWAFFWLRVFSIPKHCLYPSHCQQRKMLGNKFNKFKEIVNVF
jgi:hypothetical protein